jgi:hypothetical protein
MRSVVVWVATRKGLFRVVRGATRGWRIDGASFLGDAVSTMLPDARDGALYAAMDLGHFGAKLRKSTDDGRTWSEVAAPAFPPKPEGVDDKTGDGKPWEWRVDKIWALEPAGTKARSLWCGTIGGGLFRSDDGAEKWSLSRGLWDHPKRNEWFGGGADRPAIHSVVVHPRDEADVVVGVSCGGAWRTRDGGTTWDVASRGMFAEYMPPARRDDPYIQDPHLVAQCAASPERLWTQHHNGVFRSDDRGGNWTSLANVEPSVFGFPVAAHPRDPDTAWLVPATKDEKRIPVDGRVVVARTRDAGKTWTVLREGLPQEHAYDIVFRHALAVDPGGEVLAMGSTTGSLWISENAGDSWTSVSAHLPPVYAVKIAP